MGIHNQKVMPALFGRYFFKLRSFIFVSYNKLSSKFLGHCFFGLSRSRGARFLEKGVSVGSLFALSFRYELLPTSHFDAGQEQAYYKAHCDNNYSYEEEVGH